jgi:hypothetical protein
VEKIEFDIGEKPEQISSMCLSFNEETGEELVWAGNMADGFVCVWSLEDFFLKMRIRVEGCKGFRVFLFANDLVIEVSSVWSC